MKPTRLELSLFIMRLGVFYVMFAWALDKFLNPSHTAGVWERFYKFDGIDEMMSYGLGALQMVVLLAFVTGLFKRFSYGVVLAMHTVSTASTWQYLVNPYVDEPKAMLFMAAVPMLGACITLFLMRHQDRFLTLSR